MDEEESWDVNSLFEEAHNQQDLLRRRWQTKKKVKKKAYVARHWDEDWARSHDSYVKTTVPLGKLQKNTTHRAKRNTKRRVERPTEKDVEWVYS